jgi:acyl-coenzyme A synthetase/AMP-(fatty) acid ligase
MINVINYNIRTDIGPISRLEGVLFADKLPKTRTGKTLRRIVKNIINEEPYKEPSTIEDVHTLDPFKMMTINNGYE